MLIFLENGVGTAPPFFLKIIPNKRSLTENMYTLSIMCCWNQLFGQFLVLCNCYNIKNNSKHTIHLNLPKEVPKTCFHSRLPNKRTFCYFKREEVTLPFSFEITKFPEYESSPFIRNSKLLKSTHFYHLEVLHFVCLSPGLESVYFSCSKDQIIIVWHKM